MNKSIYPNIITLAHPTVQGHPRMPVADRAAQFAPFAALTGHADIIREAARLTDNRIELGEDAADILNEKLRKIQEELSSASSVTVTYFEPDQKKSGGAYLVCSGTVKQIDLVRRLIVMTDRTSIFIDRILNVEIKQ